MSVTTDTTPATDASRTPTATCPWPSARAAAPWREDPPPAISEALALPHIDTLSIEAVDVLVIGAGIAGLSAARAASAAGARTLALEAEPAIGFGATGRNAGILSAGVNMGLADLPPDSPDRAMWPATTREMLALVSEAAQPGALLSASLTGAFSLAETPAAARRLTREARERVALGLRAELWTPEQVAARTGGRLDTRHVVEALWLPDEGRIQPLTLLARTAAQARASGATLVGGARVVGWAAQADKRSDKGRHARHWRVRLEDGREVSAAALIVATGPVVTPTARIYALAYALDLPDDFPLFWDAAPYTYCDYRPGDGRLVTSGGRYGQAGGSPRESAYYQRLARGARRWLPELAQATPTHAWAVDLDISADLAPRLRDLDARAPGVAIEGLGALGVLPGSVLGSRAGERMAQRVQ
ncbi:MAG TPA: FAD-dependent oxidoreductase [Ktedonobacterales bacterium]|jgi:glycine/D-amino acid oxidase-like deaminating enzyme|nr:FAD-dependent oxidoreductase [Ktedonobacterales bacterium]